MLAYEVLLARPANTQAKRGEAQIGWTSKQAAVGPENLVKKLYLLVWQFVGMTHSSKAIIIAQKLTESLPPAAGHLMGKEKTTLF